LPAPYVRDIAKRLRDVRLAFGVDVHRPQQAAQRIVIGALRLTSCVVILERDAMGDGQLPQRLRHPVCLRAALRHRA